MTRLVAEGVWLCADVLEVDTLRAGALIVSVIRNGLSDARRVCAFDRVVLIYNPANGRVPFDVGRVDAVGAWSPTARCAGRVAADSARRPCP